ncbi:predicted protein [Arabidopsis lyrata subsp. lyrata]|uniref:Predicted protein n=1 Tax=Arabidopsis lyrata subsp. lyrata TaxID=81972 RepID=D7LNZ4_ARALL|nr:predicted protein [Arabidopsis lyrata subsp. lyrata]
MGKGYGRPICCARERKCFGLLCCARGRRDADTIITCTKIKKNWVLCPSSATFRRCDLILEDELARIFKTCK